MHPAALFGRALLLFRDAAWLPCLVLCLGNVAIELMDLVCK